MTKFVIAGFFILVIAGGVGFGVASADSSDELERAGAFGFDEATHSATLVSEDDQSTTSENGGVTVSGALSSAPERDITAGLKMVSDREEAERVRAEEENAAAIERVQNQKAMQGVTEPAAPAAEADSAPEQAVEYDLPKVDWSVGKEAFVTEWTKRIDAYLAGTALSGYGSIFAEAAWDNGVDPRWSPAISNTESTNGAVCFLPHNAWGWGSSSWPDWETAIREHVAGLAKGYGYSITFAAAQQYCPPNYIHWYSNTISQMALI